MVEKILIGVVMAVAFIILLIIVVGAVKGARKNKKENNVDGSINVEANAISSGGNEVIKEAKPMKIVIAQGESVVVGSEGRIPCGEYTMESCDGEETFNVRIGRYVKEYNNGAVVILTEKQKITPVSTSIILR